MVIAADAMSFGAFHQSEAPFPAWSRFLGLYITVCMKVAADALGSGILDRDSGHAFPGTNDMVLREAGATETEELYHVLTSCIMVRRLKKDVLSQLPPKRRTQVRLPPSPFHISSHLMFAVFCLTLAILTATPYV